MKEKVLYLLCLVLLNNCTGTYGLDGSDVMPRKQAVDKINNALLVKFASCGFDTTNTTLLVNNLTVSDRKVLDGAFYANEDVEFCVNSILFGTCKSALIPCNISPKDFFGGGGLFQGGF